MISVYVAIRTNFVGTLDIGGKYWLRVLELISNSYLFLRQEFRKARQILEKAYFPNATTVDAIRAGNIAYFTDIGITLDMLRVVMMQANASNSSPDKSQHKNTFFARYVILTSNG